MTTKLTCAVAPNLVYCSRENSESFISLVISAGNTDEDDPIDIDSITVTVPRGTGPNQLTTSSMTPVSLQESWRFKAQCSPTWWSLTGWHGA